ncbi:signal recognition particle-docking protein FtsY [Thermodesulfobacteriota bacterium]
MKPEADLFTHYIDVAKHILDSTFQLFRSLYFENTVLYLSVTSGALLFLITLWMLIRLHGKRRSSDLSGLESEEVASDEGRRDLAEELPLHPDEAELVVPEDRIEAPPVDGVDVAPKELEAPPVEDEKVTIFGRLRAGLEKTHEQFIGSLDRILAGRESVDDEIFDELEEALITADVGVRTTQKILQGISEQSITSAGDLRRSLRQEIKRILIQDVPAVEMTSASPFIMMVIGVNGVGKTTTIGKLSSRFADEGFSMMMVAADTFRAAAIEQLEIWSQRTGADIVKGKGGSDPSAVVYDGLEAAVARSVDVVLIDTAGRLHTKGNLMEELKKLKRTIGRRIEGAPHEVILVLDSTTGQNAIMQAKQFNEALGVTGIVLTKLDGTAKGGVIVGIVDELDIPIRYIGIGERVDDLRAFDAGEFIEALFAES